MVASLGLCVSLTACAPAQKWNPEASEKRYLLGADLFEKKQLRPALEELLQAVELNPENVDALYLLGLLSLAQAAESEAMLETATCSTGEEARLGRKDVDDSFRKAEGHFRKALAVKADFSDAWNGMAVVDLYFQRWDAAATDAEKALANALYRQPWAAQGNLGWALFQKKEPLKATKELRTALFSNPQFCVGRYRLAKIHYELGNLDGAAEEIERVTGDPKCPIQEALLLHGMVALKRGDRAGAAEVFRRCVSLAPRSCLAKQCQIAAGPSGAAGSSSPSSNPMTGSAP